MKSADTILLAITMADDSVQVQAFVVTEYGPGDVPRWSRAPTDEAITAEIARTSFDADKLPIKSWRRIVREEIPKDRTFRGAWQAPKKGRLTVDMGQAREIHRDHIREVRAYVLPDLDIAFTRAVEVGGDTAPIVTRKQALRDAPADPAIEAATTPEALAKVWHPDLRRIAHEIEYLKE